MVTGLMWKAIKGMQENKIFSFQTNAAQLVNKTVAKVVEWMSYNSEKVTQFTSRIQKLLEDCFPKKNPSNSRVRGLLWSKYHSLRNSEMYLSEWYTFLRMTTGFDIVSPIFIQYVGHSFFKDLIKNRYHSAKNDSKASNSMQDLSHIEHYAIRYTAGYIPRALKKKLSRSSDKNKKFLLVLDDLLECEEEDAGPSGEWISAIDRGGLCQINNLTFDLFLSMELTIRAYIISGYEFDGFKAKLMDNNDILFNWSMLTASWEENVADKILTMIVDLWITIRGFSLASAWVEEFKAHNKKTLQKSKGLRKQL